MYLLRHSRNNMVRMYEFTEKENRNNFVVYYSLPFWSHKIASYIKKKKKPPQIPLADSKSRGFSPVFCSFCVTPVIFSAKLYYSLKLIHHRMSVQRV